MVESRWFRRAGPGIAAAGALSLIASTTLGARPPDWAPPECGGPVSPGAELIGAWYRIDPVLDEGVWSGQRLTLGRAGGARPWQVELGAESFASGPFGGSVLVGSDDGALSSLTLFDLSAGCRRDLGTSSDVVRHATLSPDRRSVLEFRVDRRDRADLGVWRRPLDGGAPVRVVDPLQADARFGPTWRTELSWSADGRVLVAESCGEIACRFRLVDDSAGGPRFLADPSVGGLVGLVGDRLVAHGACRGLPCPLFSIDLGTGRTTVLDPAAGRAVIGRDGQGRPAVVHELGTDDGAIRVVGVDGRERAMLDVEPAHGRLVANPGWSGGAVEHAPDWVVFGPDGRLPIDGSPPAVLRHVGDGRIVPLEEMIR